MALTSIYGTIDSNGDLVQGNAGVGTVIGTAEASVTVGSISDGITRNTAIGGTQNSAGFRIDCGVLAFDAAFTWITRLVHRDAAAGTDYGTIASRGAVFQNDSQVAYGIRGNAGGAEQTFYVYQRNGSTLIGTEELHAGDITAGTIYTFGVRCQNGNQEMRLYNAAGTLIRQEVTNATADAPTDGSQHVFLLGPADFTNAADVSTNKEILAFLVYDDYKDNTAMDAIAADVYGQIPVAGGSGVSGDRGVERGFFRGSRRGMGLTMVKHNGIWRPSRRLQA